jgi:hypothetical protein
MQRSEGPMARIDELIDQIRGLENDIQAEFDSKREDFLLIADTKRVQFSEQVADLQRSKVGLFRYMTGASLVSWLVAPVIYSGFLPMLMLDAFLFVYQAACFPVYGITKVRRSEYVVLDRGDLPYLNILEKFNCFYCGYANGLMGYGREVAARTEQFFCPIKHARRIVSAHAHYPMFFEYGDADSYRMGLERLRAGLSAAEPKA